MVGRNRSQRAQILSNLGFNTVALARWLVRLERLNRLNGFSGRSKPLKRGRPLRTTGQHRAEAAVLAKLFQDCGELLGAGNIRPLR